MEEDNDPQGYPSQDDGAPKSPPRRRRPPLSCTICRRRKLKCDRSLPCGQCIKSKTPELCVYTGPHTKQSSDSRRAGNDISDQGHIPADRASSTYSGLYVFDSRHQHSSNKVTKPRGRVEELHELRSRIQSLEHALARTGTVPTPESTGYDILSDLGVRMAPDTQYISDDVRNLPERACFRGKHRRTRFCGRSHSGVTLSFLTDVKNFMRGCRNTIKSRNSELKKMKKFRGELWSREKQDHQKAYRERAFNLHEMLPPRDIADELLKLYLSTFETTYRILHVPTFRKQYDDYWAGSRTGDMVFVAKLLALMAASSCFFSPETKINGKDSLQSTAVGWIWAVQSWISSIFVSCTIEIDMLQIQCLLMLARQADAADGDIVWISSGSLIRSAMTMGMHRDPRRFPKMTKFWGEMRRRLWATILELDLQASADGGMPPSIDVEQYDCDPPLNCEDSDLTEEMTDDPIPKDLDNLTATSFQVILSRSLPLRVRIAKAVNSLRFSLSYDEALRLNEELVESMKVALVPFTDDKPSSFARSFMMFLMQRSLLMLHRPYSLSVSLSPKFSYSRKICLESSLEMLSLLESSVVNDRASENHPHLGKLGGGMFRDECFHAALTLCVELSLQANETSTSKSTMFGQASSLNELARSQQDVLVQVIERTVNTLGCRISPTGRGAKPVFFLTMALASVKAQLAGEDPLRKIEEASVRVIRAAELVMNGTPWATVQAQYRNDSVPPPMLTPDFGATPDIPFNPVTLPSTNTIDFSSLDFGNIFDFGDDEMPELWDPSLLSGPFKF